MRLGELGFFLFVLGVAGVVGGVTTPVGLYILGETGWVGFVLYYSVLLAAAGWLVVETATPPL